MIGYALFLEVVKIGLVNNNYVLCETESVSYAGESTSHSVERGVDISDHYKRQPITLSISGVIADTKNKKSSEIISNIKKLQKEGSLIKYVGRITLGNMQIQSFDTEYSNKNWGGCSFDMELKEIRIANSAYDAAKSAKLAAQAAQTSQGDNSKVWHIVKKGDCIWSLCITGPYKNLKPSYSKPMDKCNWVMSQNQSAFSRRGDFRTLQIGRKIYVGYR